MEQSVYPKAQGPLFLRLRRLITAFSKSDEEKDFYFDSVEGFIIYVDLDKQEEELEELYKELKQGRYFLIPKITLYETKKIIDGFINDKVYDIDTKGKLSDILQSSGAKRNFVEFMHDHLSEQEKWQQYYMEQQRIRIIGWLRQHAFSFVFEEDLADLPASVIDRLKRHLFDVRVDKSITQVREMLAQKAKSYYSNEAINPRPKRGRPPKQSVKEEVRQQFSGDRYTTVSAACFSFVYICDTATDLFGLPTSSEQKKEEGATLRGVSHLKINDNLRNLSQKLESWHQVSSHLKDVLNEGTKEGSRSTFATDLRYEEDRSKKKNLLNIVKELLPGKEGMASESKLVEKKNLVKKVTPIKKRDKDLP